MTRLTMTAIIVASLFVSSSAFAENWIYQRGTKGEEELILAELQVKAVAEMKRRGTCPARNEQPFCVARPDWGEDAINCAYPYSVHRKSCESELDGLLSDAQKVIDFIKSNK